MLCWTSKGIINLSREYHSGVVKNSTASNFIIELVYTHERVFKLIYEPSEFTEFEQDFQILKDCFVDIHRGSSMRLFNPPSGVSLEATPPPSNRRRGNSGSISRNELSAYSTIIQESVGANYSVSVSSPEGSGSM